MCTDVLTFVPLHGRSDPDLAAAADFFLTSRPVPHDDEDKDAVSAWSICDCRDGFVLLVNWSTNQMASFFGTKQAARMMPWPTRPTAHGFTFASSRGLSYVTLTFPCRNNSSLVQCRARSWTHVARSPGYASSRLRKGMLGVLGA